MKLCNLNEATPERYVESQRYHGNIRKSGSSFFCGRIDFHLSSVISQSDL